MTRLLSLKSISSILNRRFISFKGGKDINAELKPYRFHKLDDKCIAGSTTLNRKDSLKYFTEMTSIRLMEQEASRLYMEKEIKGFCHLYTGQEACCVGINAAIQPDDSIITAYRSHGFTISRGVSISGLLCELTGLSTGCTKGLGGSMHTYGFEFYGGNGIVGAQVPLGAGIGLAHKMRNNNKICVTLYGDGAANQGQVFEAYNMAALWKLPVVFVCENNHYGMGTSIERSCACTDLYTRGDYIPGIQVDASCVLSVREAFRFCSDYCRSGKGPLVVELVTYRYFGHSMSDPGTSYRKPSDVQEVRKTRDPITLFSKLITESELVTEQELENIKEKIQEEVDSARESSLRKSDLPKPNDCALHVYVGGTGNEKIRGCDPSIQYDSPN